MICIKHFRLIKIVLFLLVSVLTFVNTVSAHVVVRPKEVAVAAFQTFTIGVPNEKDIPTVAVRLIIPEGLKYVSPNVKSGWKIDIKREGEGEEARVTEISWTGGAIPTGQRDDFLFSAQAPSEETNLQWKAYQTYQNGETVAWDQKPGEETEDVTPYSETSVINDLTQVSVQKEKVNVISNFEIGKLNNAYVISILALLTAAGSVVLQLKKKK